VASSGQSSISTPRSWPQKKVPKAPNPTQPTYLTGLDSVSLISLSLLAMLAYHLCFQERRLV
jgi:hypothetical protein